MNTKKENWPKSVVLLDGSELLMTDKLHEDEVGIADGIPAKLIITYAEDGNFEDFPGEDEEYSHNLIFETLKFYQEFCGTPEQVKQYRKEKAILIAKWDTEFLKDMEEGNING